MSVGRGGQEIASQGKKHPNLVLVHRFDGFDRVVAVSPRRREGEFGLELIEESRGRAFPNPHGAVALHIAVPPHGTQSAARSPELAGDQMQVHEFADGLHRVVMLGEAHGPTGDALLCRNKYVCGGANLCFGES